MENLTETYLLQNLKRLDKINHEEERAAVEISGNAQLEVKQLWLEENHL